MKTIDSFYSYRTYAGNLEGAPAIEVMYRAIEHNVEKMWGDRSLHIIKPVIRKIKGRLQEYEMLPSWTHIAWVKGPEMDPENHGSELVVVWFSDESCFNGYDDIISKVEWEKYAKDFSY